MSEKYSSIVLNSALWRCATPRQVSDDSEVNNYGDLEWQKSSSDFREYFPNGLNDQKGHNTNNGCCWSRKSKLSSKKEKGKHKMIYFRKAQKSKPSVKEEKQRGKIDRQEGGKEGI